MEGSLTYMLPQPLLNVAAQHLEPEAAERLGADGAALIVVVCSAAAVEFAVNTYIASKAWQLRESDPRALFVELATEGRIPVSRLLNMLETVYPSLKVDGTLAGARKLNKYRNMIMHAGPQVEKPDSAVKEQLRFDVYPPDLARRTPVLHAAACRFVETLARQPETGV